MAHCICVCMFVYKIVLSELSECPENEYNEFPQRMRDWLFRIMRELVSTLPSLVRLNEELMSSRRE